MGAEHTLRAFMLFPIPFAAAAVRVADSPLDGYLDAAIGHGEPQSPVGHTETINPFGYRVLWIVEDDFFEMADQGQLAGAMPEDRYIVCVVPVKVVIQIVGGGKPATFVRGVDLPGRGIALGHPGSTCTGLSDEVDVQFEKHRSPAVLGAGHSVNVRRIGKHVVPDTEVPTELCGCLGVVIEPEFIRRSRRQQTAVAQHSAGSHHAVGVVEAGDPFLLEDLMNALGQYLHTDRPCER